MGCMPAGHDVEGTALKWQGFGVAQAEGKVGHSTLLGKPAGLAHHAERQIHADDRAAPGRKGQRGEASPSSDIQCSMLGEGSRQANQRIEPLRLLMHGAYDIP